jgi:hypothetical protein
MNALVKADTRTALATNAYDPFAQAGEEMGGSNAQYLKFNGNSGEFTFGAEQEELVAGTKLAVDMNSFRRGFICWKDEKVVDEHMVRVIDGAPKDKSELQDHGPYVISEDKKEGWADQAAVNFRDIASGKEYTFKVSSVSAIRALGTLLKDYSKEYKSHPGELPIITLDSSSFMPKNKAWGKKYSPKLAISEWLPEADLMAQHGDSAADYAGDDEGSEGGEPAGPEIVEQAKPTAATVAATGTAPAAAGAPRRRTF